MEQRPLDPPSLEAMVWQHETRLNTLDQRLTRIEHQLWLVLLGIMAILGGLVAQMVRM